MNQETNTYAMLSSEAYRTHLDDEPIHVGDRYFKIINSGMDPVTGFSATTFQDIASDDIVIAFRGTDDVLDGLADVGMVAARANIQAAESEVYTRMTIASRDREYASYPNKPEIAVTGHSLGGGLAQLNAERFGLHGETFNPYGIVGLRQHDKQGGDQVINHVRATDLVSASSQHFGSVRVYATSADIAALKAAGYDHSTHPGLAQTLGSLELGAHYVKNFENSPASPTIVNDVTAQRYLDNKSMVDSFRADMLNQRTLLTSQLDQPALIGPRILHGPAEAVATTAAGQGLFVAAQAAHDVKALRDGAHHVADAARSAMRHVSDTFSDPRMASALGSATYGAPTASRPDNDADLRRADHEGHAMYTQAYRGVESVDKDLGRKPDANTEKLAGAIAVAGARDGLLRIDHVILNGDGSKAFGVQGELNSPFKQIVQVDTAQAIKTPLEQSSQQWHGAVAAHQQEVAQQAARNQEQAQTQAQTQAALRPHGP
jgi:hypothetical protein